MMASTNEEDPFLQVQADVLSLLNQTRPLFSSYLRIRSSASSAQSPELLEARGDLESTLKELSEDLADLIQSVKAIEQDPYKFGVELDEVARRRRLVEEVGGEIEDMREELGKTIQEAKNKGNGSALPDPDTFDDEEDGYAMFEQERQQEIMAEQDEALDGVFRTVGNLRQQADAMGQELDEQAQMLHEVDTITDRVGGKIQSGMKKVQWVIKKNEGQGLMLADTYSSCCIAVLIVVLIILLIIVVVI
ncbi:uncharacterized protein PV09_01953 [Verruconis gallopava]|uniref:t-SNARE affecting a late Golgi compartment protein 1 n=1 Tax=Verruconis gallopava TaxID=253628 RepID=A0A0D1Z2B1_9PEZI|nr:uncharacterized protein PV09_01953 [Verruconis gallopava]KIW07062.1 hypothetical protein PV09_01953 [Verruconis gallopava]